MALSLTIIGNAAGSGGPFLAQVTAALQSTCTAILGEAIGADYVVRRKFAQLAAKSLPQTAAAMAVAVASNIQSSNPTKYTDLTTIQDVDVSNALSALFTQVAYEVILPS